MKEPCPKHRSQLDAYVDGEMPPDQVAPLTRHLATCERCRAYHAHLVRLRDGLGQLTLARESPDVVARVMGRVRRRVAVRFALAATGVLVLKLLDVLGIFGTGTLSRLCVAGGVLLAFGLLRINPFRLVRSDELESSYDNTQGVNHVRA